MGSWVSCFYTSALKLNDQANVEKEDSLGAYGLMAIVVGKYGSRNGRELTF